MDHRRSVAVFRLELPQLMVGIAIPLLVLAGVVLAVVAVVQRTMKKGEDKGGGADILAYLMLALSMGVTGFALVELANTAFPGNRFVFDPANSVATSVASIIVAAPFLVYFWRRQSTRRLTYPKSAGWTLYLALMELVFLTAFVVATVTVIHAVVSGDGPTGWPAPAIFGAVVVFHEIAARRSPPRSDAAELHRVVGSAIGLITASIGLAGTLAAVFTRIFALPDIGFDPWLAMLLVGAPIWVYRWLVKWPTDPALPRLAWTVAVSIVSFGLTVGAASGIGVLSLQYIFGVTASAGQHFEPIPLLLAILLTELGVWLVHRRSLGMARANRLRAYEYGAAAIGLVGAVTGAVMLTVLAFGQAPIVGGGVNEVIAVTVGLLVSLSVWLWFSRRHERGDPGEEATAWPRRLYNLGLGVVLGLVGAGALITTLFILLRRLLGDGESTSVLVPVAILVYTGATAWYLLAAYTRDREAASLQEVTTPFEVTIICSHPGVIATKFAPQARLQVIHRGDGVGVIGEDMADEIVAAVDNHPSLVWVDEDGFRVAPRLVT